MSSATCFSCVGSYHRFRTRTKGMRLIICLAAERMCGFETILGAQDTGEVWRVYPLSRQARNQLLLEGVCLRGHRVQVYDQNSFILSGQNSVEIPSTKLWISDFPLLCANEDTESALSRLGVVLRLKLIQEKKKKKKKMKQRWKAHTLFDGKVFCVYERPFRSPGKKCEDRGFQCSAVTQRAA